jgi:putative cardiolipin synthase
MGRSHASRQEKKHLCHCAFHLLHDGVNALSARIVLADTADRTLDLHAW